MAFVPLPTGSVKLPPAVTLIPSARRVSVTMDILWPLPPANGPPRATPTAVMGGAGDGGRRSSIPQLFVDIMDEDGRASRANRRNALTAGRPSSPPLTPAGTSIASAARGEGRSVPRGLSAAIGQLRRIADMRRGRAQSSLSGSSSSRDHAPGLDVAGSDDGITQPQPSPTGTLDSGATSPGHARAAGVASRGRGAIGLATLSERDEDSHEARRMSAASGFAPASPTLANTSVRHTAAAEMHAFAGAAAQAAVGSVRTVEQGAQRRASSARRRSLSLNVGAHSGRSVSPLPGDHDAEVVALTGGGIGALPGPATSLTTPSARWLGAGGAGMLGLTSPHGPPPILATHHGSEVPPIPSQATAHQPPPATSPAAPPTGSVRPHRPATASSHASSFHRGRGWSHGTAGDVAANVSTVADAAEGSNRGAPRAPLRPTQSFHDRLYTPPDPATVAARSLLRSRSPHRSVRAGVEAADVNLSGGSELPVTGHTSVPQAAHTRRASLVSVTAELADALAAAAEGDAIAAATLARVSAGDIAIYWYARWVTAAR